jgi:hypothetical protein
MPTLKFKWEKYEKSCRFSKDIFEVSASEKVGYFK